MNTTIRNSKVRTGAIAATLLAIGAAGFPSAHAGGFYGPRNTLPVDALPAVRQTCGAVMVQSSTGPRPPRFVKAGDLGRCAVGKVGRWFGPRATIPVREE